MSLEYLSADCLFPISSDPIEDGYIAIDKEGRVHEIGKKSSLTVSTKHYRGILFPGMVNAHCHLELSHLKGTVDTGTGLLPFLQKVVTLRESTLEVIHQAIRDQDSAMQASGIVAVGDISNTSHTFQTKELSDIKYYTFVEMFDFMQSSMTQSTIEQYQAVHSEFTTSEKQQCSYVPHAPYTVTTSLLKHVNKSNPRGSTISVHNQETPAENELFFHGTGPFHAFYKGFGFELNNNIAIGKSSIHYLIEHLSPEFKTLFVHNTLTSKEDLMAAQEWSPNVYWASCPNANLYIENSLPNYQAFLDADSKVCIGTDSLTSNWQLSVWEEIKTIKKYNSYLDLKTLLKWATLNGAEALSLSDSLGTFNIGKQPGIVHVDLEWQGSKTSLTGSTSQRINLH